MKNAFTLIEIIITLGIIVLLTSVAAPNIQSYKKSADYQSKQDEIEVLINDLAAMSKNAEQGYVKYSLTIDPNEIALSKIDANGVSVKTEGVVPSKNQIFNPQNSVSEIYCNVPGNDCFKRTIINGVTADTELSTSAGAQLFLKISDNNFNPVRIANFSIFGNPLRIVISNE